MIKRFSACSVLLSFAVLALALSGCGGAARSAFKPTRPYVEGELVVQFKEGPASMEAREANAALGATVLKEIKKLKLALIQLPPGMDTVKGVAAYRKLPCVVTAEPNYIVSALKEPAPKGNN